MAGALDRPEAGINAGRMQTDNLKLQLASLAEVLLTGKESVRGSRKWKYR